MKSGTSECQAGLDLMLLFNPIPGVYFKTMRVNHQPRDSPKIRFNKRHAEVSSNSQ